MEPWQPILDYWFGEISEAGIAPRDKYELWFTKSDATDQHITEHFLPWLQQAENQQLAEWQRGEKGWLALIVLLDQFSRNIYRGTRKAFANDEQALNLAKQGLQLGLDEKLSYIERTFFYMPFEHSESLEDQDHAVTLFEHMEKQVPASLAKEFHSYSRFARLHRDLIAKFGRFPHRNRVLERPPTEEEIAFLEKSGLRFGQ